MDNVVITEELVVKGLNISIYIYAPSVSDQPLNPTPLLSTWIILKSPKLAKMVRLILHNSSLTNSFSKAIFLTAF